MKKINKCLKCKKKIKPVYCLDWGIGKKIIDYYECVGCGWRTKQTQEGKDFWEYATRD